MKKLFAICLAIVMIASLSIGVLAAPHGFVNSPSGGRRPPVLIYFQPVDDDCTSTVIITSFGDKDNLSDADRQKMEDAYNDIINADSLVDLIEALVDIAGQLGLSAKNLGVGDLFHLGCEGCDDHEGHDKFNISLDAEGLDKFVGVMYRDDDGNWHWIEDAKVVDGKVQFTGQGYHPYAVVLNNTEGAGGSGDSGDSGNTGDKPSKTGDTSIIAICASVMAVSAAALVVVLVKNKKQHA